MDAFLPELVSSIHVYTLSLLALAFVLKALRAQVVGHEVEWLNFCLAFVLKVFHVKLRPSDLLQLLFVLLFLFVSNSEPLDNCIETFWSPIALS